MVTRSAEFYSIFCLFQLKCPSVRLRQGSVRVRMLRDTHTVHTYTHVFIYCSKAFFCFAINPSFPGLSYWNMFLILSISVNRSYFHRSPEHNTIPLLVLTLSVNHTDVAKSQRLPKIGRHDDRNQQMFSADHLCFWIYPATISVFAWSLRWHVSKVYNTPLPLLFLLLSVICLHIA